MVGSVCALVMFIAGAAANAQQQAPAREPDEMFSCHGRRAGYYADMATGCSRYHVCTGGRLQYTHACPNNTLFHQRLTICDHHHNVPCHLSLHHYNTHTEANKTIETKSSTQKSFLSAPSTHLSTASPLFGRLKDNVNSNSNQSHRLFAQQHSHGLTTPPLFRSNPAVVSASPAPTTRSPLIAPYQHPGTGNSIQFTGAPIKKQTSIYVAVSPILDIPALTDEQRLQRLRSLDLTHASIMAGNETRANRRLEQRETQQGVSRLEWTLPDTRAIMYIPDDPADAVLPNIKRYSVTVNRPFPSLPTTNPPL